jgi:hypothetical protein
MAKFNISGSFRMTARPRLKVITACVGAVLAQWGAGRAFADSAVGVDTALGNALNPPGRSAMPRPLADDGFDTVRHSPSGQLYGVPIDRSDENANKTESGWTYSGGIEAGILAGDAGLKNAKFREYKDLKNSLYLNYFEAEGDKPDTANFIQAQGGGTGQHDQFYGMQFGRYNDWKMKLFYNESIHVFTDTWKSLYNGEGSGNLTSKVARPTVTTVGVSNAGAGAGGACTPAAPCYVYGAQIYTPVAANQATINGILTTPQTGLAASIANTLAATDYSELSIVRKKGGARIDIALDNFWKGYASYSQERRTGARPYSFIESGNTSVDIAEPIDYTTHDLLAGLQYSDSLNQANLRASLSLFRNKIGTLNVQYPLVTGAATGLAAIQSTTLDLYPDSNAINLKGEFARRLPDFFNGRFTAAVAWGSNRQNDDLLAPLLNASGVATTGNGLATGAGYTNATANFDVSKWNTTAALSQPTAKQRLDSKLLDLGLSLKPTDDLSVKGNMHHYETVNKANDGNGHQYTAYNPLTGQFGYINRDVALTSSVGSTTGVGGPCYTLSGVAVPNCLFNGPLLNGTSPANSPTNVVYSLARDYKQDVFTLSADYDLGNRSSIEGTLERENYTRHMREREKTWEDKVKLGYVSRDFDIATLRASFETDRRRGGEYNTGLLANVPYYQQVAYSMALPGSSLATIMSMLGTAGYPPNAAAMTATWFSRFMAQGRKTDLADRDQDILNGRLNFNPREDLDVGVMLQFKNAKYPASLIGAQKDNLTTLNFDINYQPSVAQQITAFYSRQDGTKEQRNDTGGGTCAGLTTTTSFAANCAMVNYTGTANLGTYLATSLWNMRTKDINDVIGLAFQQDFGVTRLAVDYTYSRGRTKIGYDYGSTALPAAQVTAEAILGSAMPDMTTAQHTLTANLLVPIEKNLSARLMYRYEGFRVKDWHYDDILVGKVMSVGGEAALLLDAGPMNYHANVIGVMFQYKL